jgi:hypothetical protein
MEGFFGGLHGMTDFVEYFEYSILVGHCGYFNYSRDILNLSNCFYEGVGVKPQRKKKKLFLPICRSFGRWTSLPRILSGRPDTPFT